MKFLALALTILLAVATQARTLEQADAPHSQLEHVRAALSMYLDQVKDSAQKALGHLDDTEYKAYKDKLSHSLDGLQVYAKTASESLAPYTEAFGGQLTEAVTAIRTQVDHDIDELRKQLEPKRIELKAVLEKHVEDYRHRLEPVVQEYIHKHKENMDALKAKLEPIVEELKTKVASNVEETKAVLVPMVETVRHKLTERLEEVRTMVAPYAEEYKEQVSTALTKLKENIGSQDLQGQLSHHMEGLKEKVGPAAEEARAKLVALYETISAAMKQ